MPTTSPQISARHRVNRMTVVADMVDFLLKHHNDAGSFTATVEAALSHACELTDPQWFALGILTGHYRHGGSPDHDTTAEVVNRLERMLPTPVVIDGTEFANLPGGF